MHFPFVKLLTAELRLTKCLLGTKISSMCNFYMCASSGFIISQCKPAFLLRKCIWTDRIVSPNGRLCCRIMTQGKCRLFSCELCGLGFPSRTKLKLHPCRAAPVDRLFPCPHPQCDTVLPSMEAFESHVISHAGTYLSSQSTFLFLMAWNMYVEYYINIDLTMSIALYKNMLNENKVSDSSNHMWTSRSVDVQNRIHGLAWG